MLTEIWRYPLKSCGGELVSSVDVRAGGLVGDRWWAVVDTETGLVASAKHPRRWGSLLTASASFAGGDLEVRLPDGQMASSLDPGSLDGLLSSLVGRPVSVQAAHTIEYPTLERTDPDVDVLKQLGELELGELSTGPLGTAAPPGSVFDFVPILWSISMVRLSKKTTGPKSGYASAQRWFSTS